MDQDKDCRKKKLLLVVINVKSGLFQIEDTPVTEGVSSIYFDIEQAILNDVNNMDDLICALTFEEYEFVLIRYQSELRYLLNYIITVLHENYKMKIAIYMNQKLNCGYFELQNRNVYILDSIEHIDNLIERPQIFSTSYLNFDTFCSLMDESGNMTEEGRQTLINGFDAFLTGIYPIGFINENARYIKVNKKILNNEFPWEEILDLNSAILVEDEERVSISEFAKQQPSYFGSHLETVLDSKVYFDDDEKPYIYSIMSYGQYKENEYKNERCMEENIYLTINSKEDLECFLKDVQLFKEQGIIRGLNYSLLDECRWAGSCSIENLIRYTVKDDYSIKPCQTSNYAFGSIADDSYTKKVELHRYSAQNFNRRKCKSCESRQLCSKCVALPTFLLEENFCSIIKEYPFFFEYFLKKRVLRYVTKLSKFCSQNIDKIRVSSQVHSLIYTGSMIKINPKRFTYLIGIGDSFYVIHLKLTKILQISSKLAFVMEGYSRSDTEQEIVKLFSETFESDLDIAKAEVAKGLEILKKVELI